MKIHKMKQRSDEWFAIRKGKMTASNANTIATNGKGLENYIYSILAEEHSQENNRYISPDMQRGIDLEDQARMIYEIETGLTVEEVGFIEMDKYVGCSPDGLIGKDGGLEIKCPNDVNFFKLMIEGKKAIDSKYMWQVQMSLLIAKRKWWDLVFHNINFDKNLLVFRIKPEQDKFKKLERGINNAKNLIKKIKAKL